MSQVYNYVSDVEQLVLCFQRLYSHTVLLALQVFRNLVGILISKLHTLSKCDSCYVISSEKHSIISSLCHLFLDTLHKTRSLSRWSDFWSQSIPLQTKSGFVISIQAFAKPEYGTQVWCPRLSLHAELKTSKLKSPRSEFSNNCKKWNCVIVNLQSSEKGSNGEQLDRDFIHAAQWVWWMHGMTPLKCFAREEA